MKRVTSWIALLLLAGLFSLSGRATAVNLTLSTPDTTPGLFGTFPVTVAIEGLGDMTSPSLRGFTLRLDFDDSMVSVEDVLFGADLGFPCELGDPNPACQAQVLSFESPGSVLFAGNSLLPLALLADQPGSFVLATIVLDGLVAGLTTLGLADDLFTDLVLSDLGNPEILTQAGFAAVSLDLELVPEPTSALLLAAGLAALGLRGRRRAG